MEESRLLILLLPGVAANDFLDDLRYTGPAPWNWVNAALVLLVSTAVWAGLTILLVLAVRYLVRRVRKGHAA